MDRFRKLPTANSCPKIDWFEEVERPNGRTFTCDKRRVVELSHIERYNTKGQVKNLARALGTVKENFLAIANSIKVNGVLLTAQPPFITNDNELLDGFTRYEALLSIGATHWVFNVVEPKEGFSLEDVREEVGLGANDHPPCKAATKEDFETALARWIDRQDKTPSQGKCIDWVNSIPHSFSEAVVAKFCEKVLRNNSAKLSMESLTPTDVIQRTKDLLNYNVPKSTKIIPINLSGNSTYIKRILCDRAAALSDKNIKDTLIVGYTKGIPADLANEVRADGLRVVDKVNEEFEMLFQRRLDEGSSFKFLDVDFFAPQKIDDEDDLIPSREN